MNIPRFPRLETDGRAQSIRKLIASLNKEYSEDKSLSVLSDSIFSTPRAFVSSGVVPIDCVVCNGLGFPTGIVEIFGPETSGKSAILEHTLAAAQAKGYYTGLFPMEYSFNMKRAVSVGIDPEKLIIYPAETIEDVYDLIRKSVKKIREVSPHTPIVLGWDTIAATPTRSELEHKGGGLDKSDMGKSALQMSRLFRRLVRFLFMNQVCLLCINQTRTNLAQMWGSKETTYGGRALRFYAWIRCRIRLAKVIKEGDREIGLMCEMRVVKNKVAPPLGVCKIPIFWPHGIDNIRAVWEYGIDLDIIRRKGKAYRFHRDILTRNSFPKYYQRHKKEIDRELREASKGG